MSWKLPALDGKVAVVGWVGFWPNRAVSTVSLCNANFSRVSLGNATWRGWIDRAQW